MRVTLAAVPIALAVVTGGLIWWLTSDDAGSGVPASTADGSFTFEAPEGWLTTGCPSDKADCVRIVPPDAPDEDGVSVMGTEANPVEGTPMDLLFMPGGPAMAGTERLRVNGVEAVRLDSPATGALGPGTLVYGRDTFMISCPDGADKDRARAVCDRVVATLRWDR
ncbi:MAG TPA: hypothetical protein VM677_20470 [Actinokineospora sp.]|jgi:hypothetical protein|nr:hypothetical protein [Actinokineospora sp.]